MGAEDSGLSYREVLSGMRGLQLDGQRPVIAHASLSAFGLIRGGAETLLGAVLTCAPRLMMPTFTYKTMLIPETGPEHNAIRYGTGKDRNRMAEFFRPDMPADRQMGILSETLRRHPQALRSMHPILSFSGIGVEAGLAAQSLADPLAPIRWLAEQDGWFLLLGVNHSVNTSIHLGEAQAGRQGFTRWALTPHGVRECPQYPGCSDNFDRLAPDLEGILHKVRIGRAVVQAGPLSGLMEVVERRIAADPLALLCDKPGCFRCVENHRRIQAMV